jgi:RNA polymerase sigma-70 factor (ECF subfamily)
MPPGGRTRRPPLTLVASSGAAGAQSGRGGDARIAGERDWSHLMARAQDGDRGAYRALLEDITPYLRALAARCFRDTGDIEDAVQDALLTIHAVRHAYDPSRPFGPWLVAIANRRIIDRLRRQMRARSREIELTAEHETFSAHPANHQSNHGETAADEAVLHAAIEHLPPD